jgi:hypothetical protein
MIPQDRPKSTDAKTRHILSVPLKPEQAAELTRRAGRKPISAFVRDQLFAANDNKPRSSRPRAKATTEVAAKALALLGSTRSSLMSMAHSAASGLLPLSPDTEAALIKACADIGETKTLLMKALGIRER